MNLHELDVTKLKALAYDMIKSINISNNNLSIIEKELQERQCQDSVKEVKED